MSIQSSSGFGSFSRRMEADLEGRFPNVMKSIEGISIGKNKDSSKGTNAGFKIGPTVQKSGIYANCDSAVKPYVANQVNPLIATESPDAVVRHIQDSLAAGKTAEQVKSGIQEYMHYDSKSGKYVITPVVSRINDSLLSGTSIPYWNVGYLNKIFKQPFASSFAKNLVSVEGFGNPWCDAVAVFKESFEGFGRISNAARGTMEMGNSNPVTNSMGQIMTDIVNIAVDYESSIEENMRAKGQPGNFLSAQGIVDRERYANMVLERIHDAIIIFGNAETGTDGLIDLATGGEQTYTGTPFNDIVLDITDTTKGSHIVEALNAIIAEFLRSNLYMPSEIKINCSTYVMKAMTSTTYSSGFNPSSPVQIIQGNFDAAQQIGGGVKSCKWTLVADPMLDPNTPFNPEDTDLFIMTIPSVNSALEDQHGLVISPEPLKQFIVPPIYQRGGLLYTMYKRIGGIIAPVENTIQVWRGVGYQGS